MLNFAKSLVFSLMSRQQRFNRIYKKNQWSSAESVSGQGSELSATKRVREQLVKLIEDESIRTIVDVPCGDFNWMKHVVSNVAVDYTGIDIVEDIVIENNAKFGSDSVHFRHGDLVEGPIPRADLVIVRDCLIHLSFADAAKAIRNIEESGSANVLMSNYPNVTANTDI